MPVVMPRPQLYGILESSPEFADFVHESLGIANRAELGIAIYCDEILPGNALRHSNERKLLAFYWSLTNFRGQMTREEAWFHICVIRSNRVKLVKDGYTQVFKQLMSLFLRVSARHSPRCAFELSSSGVAEDVLWTHFHDCGR